MKKYLFFIYILALPYFGYSQQASLDSLRAIAAEQLSTEARYAYYKELGRQAEKLRQFEEAFFAYEQGEQLSSALEDWSELVGFISLRGQLLLDREQLLKAMQAFEDAIRLMRDKVSQEEINNYIYIDIGNLYYKRGYGEEAKRYYQYALAGFERQEDVSGISLAYRNLALIYKRLKMADSMFVVLDRSAPYIQEDQLLEQFNLLTYYGFAHHLEEAYDKAVDYAKRALVLAQEHAEQIGPQIGLAHLNLAVYLERDSNYLASVAHYDSALIYLPIKDFILINKASALLRAQNIEAAMNIVRRLDQQERLQAMQENERRKAWEVFMRAYEASKQPQQALFYAKVYNQYLQDRKQAPNMLKELEIGQAAISLKKDIELREQEAELRYEQALREEKEAYNRLYLSALVALLLLLFFLFWLYKQLAKNRSLLRESYAKLQQYSKNQDQLYAILAHDLRRPFGQLLQANQTLAQAVLGSSWQKWGQQAEESAQKLYFLFEELLAWIKQQRGGIRPQLQLHKWEQLQRDLLAPLQLQLADKQISLVVQAPSQAEIYTDAYLLQTILRNLMSNAIRFSPEKGQIRLSLVAKQEGFCLVIQDEGEGLSEEALAHFFEQQSSGNSGLGLSLVQSFVQLLGGKISVESQNGLLISIFLPQEEMGTFAAQQSEQRQFGQAPSVQQLTAASGLRKELEALNAYEVGRLYQLRQEQAADGPIYQALNRLLQLQYQAKTADFEAEKQQLIARLMA
ncbi:histidine kinase [Saprospira grandis DSM 2844]|uniref:histidine kinase n=1 Tax=Saprospira grandis DSM 2844 TaxID=694433 RepID=J0P2J8_9BACT|nr:sensor histidine kinase [Saprospira grandis]EJF54029.1 histidine kinase [Saprospira grandis DSM 2844]